MKTITISIRTKQGWTKAENKSKTHCDRCGETLWANPGNERYCNGNWKSCELRTVTSDKFAEVLS